MADRGAKPKFEPNTDVFTGGVDRHDEGRMRATGSTATSVLAAGDKLLGENDEGCVEYKWRLTGISPQRLEHLMTQMAFRVAEGSGQCLYELGVADDGEPRGLHDDEFAESVATVETMAMRLGLHCRVQCERVVGEAPRKRCCELRVTRVSRPMVDDLSIAMCGSVDAGKSTLIGVLSAGVLDDGDGSARQSLFNHKHELDTGRTSSLSRRVIGFDEMGRVTNFEAAASDEGGSGDGVAMGALAHAQNATKTIADRSVRLVNLVDLAGDSRYAKTTIFGITSRSPGYACIVIGSDQAPDAVAQYFHLCHALRIPHFVVVTKSDLLVDVPAQVASLLEDVSRHVSAVRLVHSPSCEFALAQSAEDAVASLEQSLAHEQHVVPVFPVSCVSGEGIARVRAFLHLLPPPQAPPIAEPEVLLDGGCFAIPDAGTVLTGLVTKGTVAAGATLLLGPSKFGAFEEIVVRSIHVNGAHVQAVAAGAEAAFAISHVPPHCDVARKGGVLAAPGIPTFACREFDAEVTVLTPDVIMPKQEPILHCRNIRQAVKIVSIAGAPFLKRNQSARMRCRLLYHPEMLDTGAVIVLRSNNTAKIVGRLVSVYPLTPVPSLPRSPDARRPPVAYELAGLHSGRESTAEASPDTRSSPESSPTTQREPCTAGRSPTTPPITTEASS